MTFSQTISLLLTATAAFAYLNHRLLRLPTVIGVMITALLASLALIALQHAGLPLADHAASVIGGIAFDDTVLHVMLGPLLFAGALFVNLDDLLAQKWTVLALSSLGVGISVLLVATMVDLAAAALGVELPWIYCLLFGALISPTDPIAVLGILRKVGVSASLETKFTGESLFNDGISVVVFIVLLEIAGGAEVSAGHVGWLFLVEVGGGVALGLGLGGMVYLLLKRVDDYQVEILLSLALVAGGYTLADALHLSGPIFAVVAGLLIGNAGRRFAMSAHSREHLDTFWELVDEVLNALLFVLIGLEVLILAFQPAALILGLVAVPVVLAARFTSIGVLVRGLLRHRSFSPHAVKILTWGGLRGAISVALALSLPNGPYRDLIVAATYVVVTFSIIVQGLSIGPMIRGLTRSTAD